MGQVSALDLCIYMYSTIGCLNSEATQSGVCNPFKLDCGIFCGRTCNIAINGISKVTHSVPFLEEIESRRELENARSHDGLVLYTGQTQGSRDQGGRATVACGGVGISM